MYSNKVLICYLTLYIIVKLLPSASFYQAIVCSLQTQT